MSAEEEPADIISILLGDAPPSGEELVEVLLNRPGAAVVDVETASGELTSFELTEIMLEGFGPHQGPNEIELKDGLTVLTGNNGTGKTHVLLAVNWCLFGDRGAMDPWMGEADPFGADLINWNSNEDRMIVEISFHWMGRPFRARRELVSGSHSFRVWIGSGKRESECSGLPPGLDPDILPYILFQGEALMFLSSMDRFSMDGALKKAVRALSGAGRMDSAMELLGSAREMLMLGLENRLERGLPVEREIGSLKGKLELIERDLERTEGRIDELEGRKKRTLSDYRSSLKALSSIHGVPAEEKRRIRLQARLPLLREQLGEMMSHSAREILRKPAIRALDQALRDKEERTRKRLMYGAIEAQSSIVSAVISSGKCICGSQIGRTGMGKERLEQLRGRLEARKEDHSDWGREIPWTADIVLENARRVLASEPFGRDEVKKVMSGISKCRAGIGGGSNKERKTVVTSMMRKIKDHEETVIKLSREREEFRRLRSERDQVRKELHGFKIEIAQIWGKERDSTNYVKALATLDEIYDLLNEKAGSCSCEFARKLETESNSVLKELDTEGSIGTLRIHPDSMSIGLVRDQKGDVRILPMFYLSAGEREALAMSMILAISKLLGTGLILDSPFMYMDRSRRKRFLEVLPKHSKRVLLTVPEGGLSGAEQKRISRQWSGIGRGVAEYRLVKGEKGSNIVAPGGGGDE
ncbi:MAG: AAA family ATPase [Thermoplasmatota archaeon]